MKKKMQKVEEKIIPEMRYFYLGTNNYKFGDPVIAFGYVLNLEDKEIDYSLTICSTKDVFTKEKARNKLQKRMHNGKFRTISYPYDKPSSRIIIVCLINEYHWNNRIENYQGQEQYFYELGMENRPCFLSNNLFEQFPELKREKKEPDKIELEVRGIRLEN